MWIGSMIILSRVLCVFSDKSDYSESLFKMAKKLYFAWLVPGILIVLVSGLYQLGTGGMSFYMAQHWFTTKLLFVLILLVNSVVLYFCLAIIAKNKVISKGKLMGVHGLSGLLFIIIVFLTQLGKV